MTDNIKQSRRNFLKNIAYLSATSAIIANLPWISTLKAVEDTKSPSDRIRIGVIGVGSRGKKLLLHLQSIPNVEIAAVCDNYKPNFERAVKLAGKDAYASEDYRKILELKNLDAIVIATPLHEHAHITVDSLQSGKHTFCEKSMARTPQGCKDMVEAHRETGKILYIGHQRIFNPVYLKAYEMIKAGRIGKITQIRAFWHRNNDWRRKVPHPGLERKINWRLYREYSCGLMTELASHQIQVGDWFIEKHPEFVMGSGSINYWNDGREVYDNVNLVYGYPGGTHMIYDSMCSNKHYGLEEQIMGPKGTIEPEKNKIYSENPPPAPGILQLINDIEKSTFKTIPVGGASWVPETAKEYKGEYIVDKYPITEDTQLQMEAFVQSVRDNKQIDKMIDFAYYASLFALLGDKAMREQKIIHLTDEWVI